MMEDVETTTTNVGATAGHVVGGTDDRSLPVASAVPAPMQTGEVLNFAQDTTEGEEDVDNAGPTSSFENVLPMDKLKKGWAQWSVFGKYLFFPSPPSLSPLPLNTPLEQKNMSTYADTLSILSFLSEHPSRKHRI